MREISIAKRHNLGVGAAYPSLNDSHFYIKNSHRSITVYYFKRVGNRQEFSKYELKGPEIDIWKNINGSLKSKDILSKLKKSYRLWAENGNSKNFYRSLRKWRRTQLIHVSKEPLIQKPGQEPQEKRLVKIGLDIIREVKTVERIRKGYSSYCYHKKSIEDAQRQFDNKEITFSHTLRNKTSVLDNNAYGARFAEAILDTKKFSGRIRILEVGAGLGWLGYNFIKKIKADFKGLDLSYSFLDLSAALLKEQRRLNYPAYDMCDFTQADACKLPFKDGIFDLVIANECIADFPVIKLAKNDISAAGPGQNRVIRRGASYIRAINKFNKYLDPGDDLMPQFIFPIGIVYFLEELKRVLRPEAIAVLVEYSFYPCPVSSSVAVKLPGHFEYSADFRLLKSVAKNMGFAAKIMDIDKFLNIDSVPLLSFRSKVLLDKFLIRKTRRLSSRVYTRAELRRELGLLADKIRGLEFISSKKEIGGLVPSDFKVMLLRSKSG